MKTTASSSKLVQPDRLTSERAEKISAIEGLALSPRMRDILARSARDGLSGDETRALIRAAFAKNVG